MLYVSVKNLRDLYVNLIRMQEREREREREREEFNIILQMSLDRVPTQRFNQVLNGMQM